MAWWWKERVGLILLAAFLAALLWVFSVYQPTGVFSFGLGLLAALDTGMFGTILTFELQRPNIDRVWSAGDKWDPNFRRHFIHVVVRNNAHPFMGGGAAIDLRGNVTIDADAKVYSPKWVAKSEPVDIQYLPTAGPGSSVREISRLDPGLVEDAKVKTIGPGENQMLDIAMKVEGDALCYVHEPENYGAPDHKKNPLGAGTHKVHVTLSCGGRSFGPFEFTLKNGDGTSPGSLSLEPSTDDESTRQP